MTFTHNIYIYKHRYSSVRFVNQTALNQASLPVQLNKFEDIILGQCAEARSIFENE